MNRAGHKAKDTASVADSFEKLYGDLPSEIGLNNSNISNVHSSSVRNSSPVPNRATDKSKLESSDKDSRLVTFLKEQLPRSDHKEVEGELKKTFPLHKQKGGKIKKPQPRRKGKYLTAHERRKLGLNRLPKSGGLKVTTYRNILIQGTLGCENNYNNEIHKIVVQRESIYTLISSTATALS